jgi:cell division protein FtsX
MGKLVKMAWRNVWRNRRRTVIAVIATALGLALMLFFDGLMDGAKQATTLGGDVVCTVRVDLAEQPPELRWGMSTKVEIATD